MFSTSALFFSALCLHLPTLSTPQYFSIKSEQQEEIFIEQHNMSGMTQNKLTMLDICG